MLCLLQATFCHEHDGTASALPSHLRRQQQLVDVEVAAEEDDPCPVATDTCMNEDNRADCRALVDAGCSNIATLESCPLQFQCADDNGNVDDTEDNNECCWAVWILQRSIATVTDFWGNQTPNFVNGFLG